MEKELQELLRTKADDVMVDLAVPKTLVRRSRRRRAFTASVVGVTAALVAVAGFLGVRATLHADSVGPATSPKVSVPAEPTPTPTALVSATGGEADVRNFVSKFLEARILGSASLMETFLSPGAKADYDSRANHISLYGGDGGLTDRSSVEFVARNEDGTWQAIVRLFDAPLGETTLCPFNESLIVGAGADLHGDASHLVVLEASRGDPGSNMVPLTTLAAHEFVCAFMDERRRGDHPESRLSAEAMVQYKQQGVSLLEADDPDGSWFLVEVTSVEQSDANSYQVVVRVDRCHEPATCGGSFQETLFVGPGRDLNGEPQPAVIRGAESTSL